MRLTARVVAVAANVAGVVFLFSATAANDVWPWKLTPLSAGVVDSFTIQVGVGALLLSLDERWSFWRLLLETFLVATALLLIGTARAWSTLDHSNPSTWLLVAGLAAFALAILGLFTAMARTTAAGRDALVAQPRR